MNQYDDLVSILRLIRTENVGVKTFWHLISLYGNAEKAIENLKDLSLRGGKVITPYSKSKAEEEISVCIKKNIKIVSHLDDYFPKIMQEFDDRPPLLFCLGNAKLLNSENIAIVGSRNASANGLRLAYKIAKNLSEHKKTIVSGFARGIDSAAHKASVDYATIAVLAGGIDHIYPPENAALYHEIAEKGLIVAELPLGAIPKSQNFPQRNRIISGISKSVAIIEATLKSGSLITAKFALQQNKEIFAVPGFPLDPHYQGTNKLLKEGAHLLESAEDILQILESYQVDRINLNEPQQNFYDQKNNFIEKELTEARIQTINLLGASPVSIDEIISITQLPANLLLTIIVELELAGKIIRHFGNKVSLKL